MSRIRIELVGTTPLIMHNVQLADPDNPVVREIASITSKRKKTEDDRKLIARYEWYGGLYELPDVGPVVPSANIKKCFNQAAKVKKLGKDILRSFYPIGLHIPLSYDGPRDIDKLFTDPKYHFRTAVGIMSSKTMRTRPQFPRWSLVFDAELIEDAMDFDVFKQVGELAGTIEGLGDNRINGYGRFTFSAVRI